MNIGVCVRVCVCVCPGALLGAANAGEACSKTRDKETLLNGGDLD